MRFAYSPETVLHPFRIPWVASPKARRIEVRFPDPTPIHTWHFSAMLMAGLDGIRTRSTG